MVARENGGGGGGRNGMGGRGGEGRQEVGILKGQ